MTAIALKYLIRKLFERYGKNQNILLPWYLPHMGGNDCLSLALHLSSNAIFIMVTICHFVKQIIKPLSF